MSSLVTSSPLTPFLATVSHTDVTSPFRQNRVLEHSKTDGIIISNYSLALQSVQRRDAGVYMCVGFNSEGESESNSIFLDIKCEYAALPGRQM